MTSSFEYFQNIPVEQTDLWKYITPGKPDSTRFCHGTDYAQIDDARWQSAFWKWVSSLDNNPHNDSPFPGTGRLKPIIIPENGLTGFLRHGILRLHSKTRIPARIRLYSLKGRRIELRKLSNSLYAVSDNKSQGLYMLKYNDKSALIRSF
jgi:hypothetical protein